MSKGGGYANKKGRVPLLYAAVQIGQPDGRQSDSGYRRNNLPTTTTLHNATVQKEQGPPVSGGGGVQSPSGVLPQTKFPSTAVNYSEFRCTDTLYELYR
jgi:hypothetical protein